MENLKKIFFFYLIIALVGCSSKDDADLEETDPREAYFLEAIVGSWAYDTVKVNGQLFQYQHTEDCVKDLFQFYNTEGKEFDFEESVVLN